MMFEGSWRPKGFDAVQEPLFSLRELAPREEPPQTLTVNYADWPDGWHAAADLKVQRCPKCGRGCVRTERETSSGVKVEYVHAHQILATRGRRKALVISAHGG